jgi:hypothetical protein
MKFQRLLCFLIALEASLVGATAHASYVVEADAMGTDQGATATGADFDFVARDFGMEPRDAIQIALDNLASAANLRGNLLLMSFDLIEQSDAEGPVIASNREDYSYYDESPVATGELVPEGVSEFAPIDSNAIFWILRPTEFTSFSQLTAARFGFDHSQ